MDVTFVADTALDSTTIPDPLSEFVGEAEDVMSPCEAELFELTSILDDEAGFSDVSEDVLGTEACVPFAEAVVVSTRADE